MADRGRGGTDGRRVADVVGRTALWLALTAVVVVSAVRLMGPPPTTVVPDAPTGTLQIGERAQGTYQVAGHTVVLTTQGLSISHPRSVVEVWASPLGRSFVAAARGEATLSGGPGMVRVRDRWDVVMADQTVDGADVDSDGRLVLSGQLTTAEEGETVAYQLFVTPAVPAPGLTLELAVLGDVDRVTLTGVRALDERVMGMGAQFTATDLRGRAYPILPRDQGIGRGDQPLSLLTDLTAATAGSADTTPAPLPVYVTSAPRSLWLTGAGVSVIDLRGSTTTPVTVWDDHLTAVVAVGRTPVQHVSAHARATGLMRALPGWSGTGVVAGLQGGTVAVQAAVAALRDAGVPLAAVWIPDWAGGQGAGVGSGVSANWTLDRDRYPGWQTMVEDLADARIRTLTYATPSLSPAAGAKADRDLFAEAADGGFLITDPSGEPLLVADGSGGEVAWVDLFDDDARDWYAGVLAEEVLGGGASGFMADLGETLPLDARSSAGASVDLRGRYPTAWARTTRQALEEAGLGEEGLVWHRSAGPGSAAYATLFWAGEQTVDFATSDGLPSALDGMLNASASGMSYVHHDIGGHTSVTLPGLLPDLTRSAELHQRSAELAAFTALMRTTPGNRPDLGVQATDEAVVDHLAAMADLFVALQPERTRLASAATLRGLPLLRHPMLVVPEQPEVALQPGALFLGQDLFVAPVLREGQRQQTVRLPVGEWVHVWSGATIARTRSGADPVTVDAPIGQPPAWARLGSRVAADLQSWRDRTTG